ncbi:hypothetical protein QJS10_CPB20g02144 [Acorus calamus]|uniref:Uncharacterized protein n=1 Tax=Acorus calamus TaxID=4465 RepID=A0AAV9CC40_ACOCL|nr:hypothetical protein QJS10_CPB20g02144 [Acorus calamus]
MPHLPFAAARMLEGKQVRKGEVFLDRRHTKSAPNQPPRLAAQPPPTSDVDENGLQWTRE